MTLDCDIILGRIDVLEERINHRLEEIDEKVDQHGIDIAQAKGGLKAARWLFSGLVSLAGFLGFSHFYKH